MKEHAAVLGFLLVFLIDGIAGVLKWEERLYIKLGQGGNVNVIENGSFIQKVVHDEDIEISNCVLEYKRNSSWYFIELDVRGVQTFPSEVFFGERLSNVGGGVCGFRISERNHEDPDEMGLAAVYVKNHTDHVFDGRFTVTTIKIPQEWHDVEQVMLGARIDLKCRKIEKASSCELINPDGNVVSTADSSGECLMQIWHVTMDHVGNWTCNTWIIGAVDAFQSTYELRLIENLELKTWYKEEQGYGMIGCQNISVKAGPIEICQFVSPLNEIYTLFLGSDATERFTSVGTDYEKSICQIEFKLPIRPEETGNWKCLTSLKDGTYVQVNPHGTTQRNVAREYAKRSVLYLSLGDPLEINCRVPYPTFNCYIKNPNKEYIYGGDERTFRLGECNAYFKISNATHLGTWSCHFSQVDVAEDEIHEIDVREMNTVMSTYKTVDTIEDQSAELLCEATVPIQSCQYVGPSGISYNMFPGKQSVGMDYVGRGLNYGDCGIRIDAVKPEHEGAWTCLVNNLKDPNRYLQDLARINVNQVGTETITANAAAIGIPVAIAVVAVFMFAVVLYKRYRKRIRYDNARVSEGSNGMTTGTPIVNMPMQQIYSTSNDENNFSERI